MFKLIAWVFGEDTDAIFSFDLARLTIAGWLVAASTIAAMGTFIVVSVEYKLFTGTAKSLGFESSAYIGGMVALFVGFAWFKACRFLFSHFHVRLYYDKNTNASTKS